MEDTLQAPAFWLQPPDPMQQDKNLIMAHPFDLNTVPAWQPNTSIPHTASMQEPLFPTTTLNDNISTQTNTTHHNTQQKKQNRNITNTHKNTLQKTNTKPQQSDNQSQYQPVYIGCMHPNATTTHHPAHPILEEYMIHGCPMDCREPWSQEHLEAAVRCGNHPSANTTKACTHLWAKALNRVNQGTT